MQSVEAKFTPKQVIDKIVDTSSRASGFSFMAGTWLGCTLPRREAVSRRTLGIIDPRNVIASAWAEERIALLRKMPKEQFVELVTTAKGEPIWASGYMLTDGSEIYVLTDGSHRIALSREYGLESVLASVEHYGLPTGMTFTMGKREGIPVVGEGDAAIHCASDGREIELRYAEEHKDLLISLFAARNVVVLKES